MADETTGNIIAAAIEVHKNLGPGLLESIYENALCHEFDLRDIRYERQLAININYKGIAIKGQRIDLVVESEVIVELKATHRFKDVFISQALSYLKAAQMKKALIINFSERRLINGIKRVSL